jgi:two-component system, cell cycle response regulator
VKGCVLVIDDSPLARQVMVAALRALGHTTREAADGERGLAHVRPSPSAVEPAVDVVILDLLMPVLDGFATLERLKADPATAHVPVIVVSGVEDRESLVRCIELGATDHLTKPFDRHVLRARVASALAAKRLRDLELDHLRQVEVVTRAAAAIEAGRDELDPELADVAARDDALGALGRQLQRLALEVAARERRLRRELDALRIEVDASRVEARVEEVTGTSYYRRLAADAEGLRRLLRLGTDGEVTGDG